MTLMLPVTVDEVLRGIGKSYARPENETGVAVLPRASGLASCARKQAFDMAGMEPGTDWGRPDSEFTQEQGRLAEDITIAGINASGKVRVVNRQIEVPQDGIVTGHPDGSLEFLDEDFWDYMDHNALSWGFEHKHFGQYAYTQILRAGLEECEPGQDLLTQVVLYGDALSWDACLVAVTSQDASVIRRDITRSKKYKDHTKRWGLLLEPSRDNPKLQFFAVDLRPLYDSLLPRLRMRAVALANARDPWDVVPEGEPHAEPGEAPGFPCGWCGHRDECVRLLDIQTPTLTIPKVRPE